MRHAFRIKDDLHEVWLSRTARGYVLHLGEERISVAMHSRGEHLHELVIGDTAMPVFIAIDGDDVHMHVDGMTHVLSYTHSLDRFAGASQDRSDAVARAPMPGAVIALETQPGKQVRRGDVLMVIESMKMETAICAGIDGVVQAVHVQPGETFERDALLVTLEPVGAQA